MNARRLAGAAALLLLAGLAGLALTRREGPESAGADAERLRALGYLDWAPLEPGEERGAGVTRHDRERAWPGLNLVTSRSDHRALLLDMDGGLVHQWTAGVDSERWHHAEPTGDGGLVVVDRSSGLLRIDRDSRVLWRRADDAHHDVAIDDAGRVHALVGRERKVPFRGREVPILSEAVAVLAPDDGRVLAETDLHPALGDLLPGYRLAKVAHRARGLLPWLRARLGLRAVAGDGADVYHLNTLEILPRAVPGLGARGDLLVCARNLDLVAVVSLDPPRRLWSFGPGVLERPHQPSLLPDGNLLVFDNGRLRRTSRVLEIEPASGRILWEWSGEPPGSLRSARQGGAQALPNGNVLVTESERGRALEVTRTGEIVWEYKAELDPEQRARRSIYRVTRLASEAWGLGTASSER